MTNDKSQITNVIVTIKQKIPGVMYSLDEEMRNHTSFKIGGAVRIMFFPESTDHLSEIFSLLAENEVTPLIIGNGSNLLVSDESHDLVVINTLRLNNISLFDDKNNDSQEYCDIVTEAGALLSSVANFAYNNGLTGLEFAHGIPGTVGGAVVMNAGAYGSEMKDIIYSTTAYNKAGEFVLTAADNEFSYRRSRFTDTNDIVLSSVLRLYSGDKENIKKKMDDLYTRRRESQPLDLPSGGSTFKRPKEGYAAALIEQAGLKGFTIGGAQVSEKHSGFIINKGNATFNDVIAVMEHVQETVYKKLGVQLEPEIKIIRS